MPHVETISPSPPQVDPDHYQVLRPDSYHTSITSQEKLLEKYIHLLNPIIEKVAGSADKPGFDSIVFLDKSARPLYWMLKEMWPYIAPQVAGPDGQPQAIAMPDIKFANIDRLAWRKDPQQEIEEGGARQITSEDAAGLRAIFNYGSKSNDLVGKRVLIIDEQAETGDTMKVARRLFEKAFPESDFETMAWIRHPHSMGRDGTRVSTVKEIPMWYPPKDAKTNLHKETGRGVFGPVPYIAGKPYYGAEDRFPPESYQFLSSKPRLQKMEFSEEEQLELAKLRNQLAAEEDQQKKQTIRQAIEHIQTYTDPESIQLRREIGQMALDFASGKLFPVITTDRVEILGLSPREYNLKARAVRESRPD